MSGKRTFVAALALCWAALPARADAPHRAVFGTLRPAAPAAARQQALDWLRQTGRADEATLKQFDTLWARDDLAVLDRVAGTFELGEPAAALLLAAARDPLAPAPTEVPSILKDTKVPAFLRANLALAYGRALSGRRVYEEALAALRLVRPEQVVDPGAYFFHRAVAEHALGQKSDASASLVSLTESVAEIPERYQTLAALMAADMQAWKDKDLGTIARKMSSVERRLELARGGPQTQKIQRDIVNRLDEIIKKLDSPNDSNGGGCPNGGQGGGPSANPMRDSGIARDSGPGKVDDKKLKGLAQQWGKLPDKERAKAMQDLIRDMPERHRDVIEAYFKKLAQAQPGQP